MTSRLRTRFESRESKPRAIGLGSVKPREFHGYLSRRAIFSSYEALAQLKAIASSDAYLAIGEGTVTYEQDLEHPELLIQISPDGTRVSGILRNRKFIPR